MSSVLDFASPWHYATVLLACLVVTSPLEFVLGARVYRRPKRLVTTILIASLPFLLWDAAAITAGHWAISEEFTLGLDIGGVPVEEICFFVVIPVCALLTYEVVDRHLRRRPRR